MDELFWRNLGIFLHLIGIVFLSAGLVGTIVLDNWFWRVLNSEPVKAQTIVEASQKLNLLTQIGSGLMLISGLQLLFLSRFNYTAQLWMILKLILFVLLAVNGAVVGGRALKKIQSLMPQWVAANTKIAVAPGGTTAPLNTSKETVYDELVGTKRTMVTYHYSENLMFVATIILGVFKIGS
jgi:hypothetical protein